MKCPAKGCPGVIAPFYANLPKGVSWRLCTVCGKTLHPEEYEAAQRNKWWLSIAKRIWNMLRVSRLANCMRREGMRRLKVNSGDPCPENKCPGALVVYSTRVVGETRIRYLHCGCCGFLPENNEVAIPLEFAPRRTRRGP